MGAGKGGGAVAPWGGAYGDVASSVVPDFFGGSMKETENAFGKKKWSYVPGGDSTVEKAGKEYAKPTGYEIQAGSILSGMDPNSWLSGVQGYLNEGQGALGQALSGINAGGFGGSDAALQNTIQGGNLDVTGGAYANRNAAVQNQVQRMLNQNLDTVGAEAQRASGGVGAGSAGVEAKRRTVTEAGSMLGDTLAQLSAQDLARERGLQEAAISQGLNLPIARAGALGNIASGYQGLGSIFGQAGTAAGNQSIAQAGALGELGNLLAGRQLAGSTMPLDYMLNFLSAARQSPGQPGQSVLGSILQGAGGLAKGLGGMGVTF